MGVPPLVSSILQCLRADYYALLLVHRGSFILACIFIPHLVIDSRPRWTSGNWPLDSIASWQSFPVCIVSTVVIGIKDKNTYANIFLFMYFYFHPIVLIETSIRYCGKAFVTQTNSFFQGLKFVCRPSMTGWISWSGRTRLSPVLPAVCGAGFSSVFEALLLRPRPVITGESLLFIIALKPGPERYFVWSLIVESNSCGIPLSMPRNSSYFLVVGSHIRVFRSGDFHHVKGGCLSIRLIRAVRDVFRARLSPGRCSEKGSWKAGLSYMLVFVLLYQMQAGPGFCPFPWCWVFPLDCPVDSTSFSLSRESCSFPVSCRLSSGSPYRTGVVKAIFLISLRRSLVS